MHLRGSALGTAGPGEVAPGGPGLRSWQSEADGRADHQCDPHRPVMLVGLEPRSGSARGKLPEERSAEVEVI